jgi:hypothetical protein
MISIYSNYQGKFYNYFSDKEKINKSIGEIDTSAIFGNLEH